MDQTSREAVLQLFTEADDYLSGEDISVRLGCTRAAVWKQVNELRRLGYQFDAKPRKGYRLMGRPDLLIAEEIKCFNQAKQIGKAIRYVDKTPSTQLLAHEWADEGAEHGSLIIADEQTGGKGRMGRMWHSPPGSGIWMSIVLNPHIPLVHAPHLTLLLSVAITRALKKSTGVDIGIKWPNDLFVAGRKVCGVLTEVRAEADQIHYCAAGIGINVHDHAFPQELRKIATSLSEVAERPLHRAELVASCCMEIEQLLQLYWDQGFSPVQTLWETHAFMLHQQVTVHSQSGTKTGVAIGLDNSGALRLQTDGGVELIYSADVSLPSP